MTIQGLVLTCLLGAGLSGIFIYTIMRHFDQKRQTARALLREAEEKIVFLFDDHNLIDATPAARALIKNRMTETTDWDRFVALFAPHFPHLRSNLETLAQDGRRVLTSPDNPDLQVIAEYWNGLSRISYDDGSHRGETIDRAAAASLNDELQALRNIAEDSPQLIWKQDINGTITWANRAYLDLASQHAGCAPTEIQTWPPLNLFNTPSDCSTLSDCASSRQNVHISGDPDETWFDISCIPRPTETLFFATNVTKVVQAEETQRSYVQTLVKTFAQLSIGLAIFDRERRLMIFNPALMDLTGIRPEFLASRPGIHTFLDRMREARMIPEPKNYTNWRETIIDMETRAKDGTYCEKWDLPNGQTFRVTGRPHPDGALAFLFEDISAEISLTRRFRNQIDSSQAVLDNFDTAVAVFSSAGTLTIHNSAYEKLWHHQPMAQFVGTTLLEESRIWQKSTVPTPVWSRLREELCSMSPRSAWNDSIRLNNGREIACCVKPLPNGDTLVEFRPEVPLSQGTYEQPTLWAAHG